MVYALTRISIARRAFSKPSTALMPLLQPFQQKMQNTVQDLEQELGKLQVGRPSPQLVEQAPIVANGGANALLSSIARVWVQDASTLRIEVPDAKAIRTVEGAISNLKLGILPAKIGPNVLELCWEKPTAESREALVSLIGPLAERFKCRIRTVRKEALKARMEGQSKDVQTEHENQVQKMHDHALQAISDLAQSKKRSLLRQGAQ